MSYLRFTFILNFSLILCLQAGAQNCLDYGEFDDPACTGLCGPSGWNNSGTAYIVEGDVYDSGTYDCSYNVPESPTGGTYQTLWDSNTGTIAGEINTTITGLTPGTEYSFGFWAATPSWICGGVMSGGGIELSVSIDGNSELVPTDIGWNLFEYCVTATSSSMDIGFTVAHTGFVGPALIDDAFCSDLTIQCCELALDAESNLEVCPFEDLVIDLSYENEVGNVDISWSSSPPSGLGFLDTSDPNQIIFNYDSNIDLSVGSQFILTAEVSDDLCELAIEVVVDVLPYPEVSFDFEGVIACSNEGEFILPTTANSGVTGEWDVPTLFLQDHPGELLSVYFTITDPNSPCPTTTEHFIEVQEEIFSSFDFPLTYCRAQNDIVYFETNTLEGHSGTWDPPLLELDLLTDGLYDISFTPDDPFCINGLELEIEIYSGDQIEFDLPELICANGIYTFPITNQNNVPGFWEFESMDLTNVTGVVINTFTANTIECYEDYIYTFEVLDDLEATFNIPSTICSADAPFSLASTSNEAYLGEWSTALIDPSVIVGNSFTSTWTPAAGQSDCLIELTIEIPVTEAVVPDFTIPSSLCTLDPQFTFPTVSGNQNIMGTWDQAIIDPQSGPATIQNTFTPASGQCAETITIEIEILAPITPDFSFNTLLCELDDVITLPTVSDNNIQGNWDIPVINPVMTTSNEIAVTFQADATNNCVENFDVIFQVEPAGIPQFDLPSALCWSDNDFTFPDISNDGIIGSWTNPSISTVDNVGQVISSTFIPSDESCTQSFTATISIVEPFFVFAEAIDPSDCELTDGEIQISGELDNLEFSIDGGLTWQSSPSVTQLGAGLYEVLVRSSIALDCFLILNVNLDAQQGPSVGSIESTNITGCGEEDGTITINIATNDINEYSIDGGLTWQTDHTFANLAPGTYEIGVRNFGSVDCVVNATATIEDFPETEITNVVVSNISDCQEEDGSILIEATGINLEYSIDGGANWSDTPLFLNLSAGNYQAIARSIDSPDCFASEEIMIIAPNSPVINSLTPSNSSTCFPFSGSILIETESEDNLYSLDGNNWQEENIFENLEADNYTIFVQSQSNPNCITEDEIDLIEIEDSLPLADYSSTPPSVCNVPDASLTILINASDVEFSIDLGSSWQTDPNFSNLPAGNYLIIIRKLGAEDCTSEFFVNIDNPDCPCNDLIVELGSNNIDCSSTGIPSVELLSVNGNENPDFSILWQDGSTSTELADLETGWQVITIFYDEGCAWSDSIYIEIPTSIEFEYIIQDSDCTASENGTIEILNANGGSGDYNFGINSSGLQASNQFQNLVPGIYELIVQDSEGCSQTAIVELSSIQELTIELEEIQNFNLGDTILLDPKIDLMAIDSFSWSPSTNILNPGELIAQVIPSADINYELEIFYGECTERASILLDLNQVIEIYLPNIINPNSNDNNTLYPLGNEFIELHQLSIYDRWGELIYAADTPTINDPSQGWNGRFNGQIVNPGVFVYLLEFEGENGLEQKVGTVTVLY